MPIPDPPQDPTAPHYAEQVRAWHKAVIPHITDHRLAARIAMIVNRIEAPELRFARLVAASKQHRSGCNRLFTLRGHYDTGYAVIEARALFRTLRDQAYAQRRRNKRARRKTS